MTIEKIKEYLKQYDGEPLKLMEVCGSHTSAIAKFGIPGMLSEKIELISGPGCPVCVTPSSYIDRLIELGRDEGNVIVTFGDLIRVPGSSISLSQAKGEGVNVRMVYSPMDVIGLAEKVPDKQFIFAAVGFETTMPAYAGLLDEMESRQIENIRLLTALKTMPPIIDHIMENGADIDGFITPGHVSVVTGSDAFLPLAKKYGIPFVVSGFSGQELLIAIYDLVRNRENGIVKNDYPSVVTAIGNEVAKSQIDRYFIPSDAVWRGVGMVTDSGMLLRKEYSKYDMGSAGLSHDEKKNPACICDRVLMGKAKPSDCSLFKKACTPRTPQGACMVSAEGCCFVENSI